jgi:ribonucleoside-diphosphate reductase alpha chain
MMDNTIDASGFPLETQRQEAIAKRRIGLGMTSNLPPTPFPSGLRSATRPERAKNRHKAARCENEAFSP